MRLTNGTTAVLLSQHLSESFQGDVVVLAKLVLLLLLWICFDVLLT